MKQDNLCPICGDGILQQKVTTATREFNGKQGVIAIHYSECSECGCETASEKDMKLNARNMNKFKKQCLGLLTGKELLSIRNDLGISQREAADVFGGGPNSFTKYEHDDVIQSVAMDRLIRTAYKYDVVLLDLCKQAGISTNKMHLHKIIKASISKEIPSQYTELAHYSHGISAKQLVS
ncbi:type II toxin-antitoxin system MqsA family antitoxin [Providencia stuartii]|uniref:type II toxin-antitoxin system MqsA family antitoxin n=1 Tax=Providencia sp. PROV119 TaxID=2949830 RepID=UPI00234A2084|nr:type II toxin-antitoxin system MqsA family antitoxin [Providencia sp. PROV119]HEK0514543.1 type II toxin-antitoxin system MqsA family antitoxin [Proteus mirabilis]HEM6896110.1 type II toxin-antitoxin system MqsA family antitoxin [Providencia stuartii]